jgi:hypothetical protein
VAVKPTVGVIDLATQTTRGIRNTATMFDGKARQRRRPPRYFGTEAVLEPYDKAKAIGVEKMMMLDDGKYKLEVYLYHVELEHTVPKEKKPKKRLLLVTDKHIFFRTPKSLKDIWKAKMGGKKKRRASFFASFFLLILFCFVLFVFFLQLSHTWKSSARLASSSTRRRRATTLLLCALTTRNRKRCTCKWRLSSTRSFSENQTTFG